MARQVLLPGKPLDILTPEEAAELIAAAYREDVTLRVRAGAIGQAVAGATKIIDVYKVPAGFEFEARRIFLDLSTGGDTPHGGMDLTAAPNWVEYLRSGDRIEWGQPQAPTLTPNQIPGVQTWGSEQGPYLRNGEVFQVRVNGVPMPNTVEVSLEGILRRPPRK